MMGLVRSVVASALLASANAANAQVYPMPGPENPRLQNVSWQAGQEVVLTALPESGLLVVLEPGEGISRVVLSDSASWEVNVSSEFDTFLVVPVPNAREARLTVETGYRTYDFALRTSSGLTAAVLVRFSYGFEPAPQALETDQPSNNQRWSYRLRGDSVVRPSQLYDDGSKTFIEYLPDQPLPAVFAIGASGEEEVVDGHMRDGQFVIDHVHQELVFRIDEEKATARRNPEAEEAS